MAGPRWAPEAESRVTAVFRGAPFTWRKDGTFRVDTDPRLVTARENLNWSIVLGESLCQLGELVALGEPKGKP